MGVYIYIYIYIYIRVCVCVCTRYRCTHSHIYGVNSQNVSAWFGLSIGIVKWRRPVDVCNGLVSFLARVASGSDTGICV